MTGAAPACSIRSAGFLIALSEDWSIEAVSANIRDFVECEAEDMIGRPASEVLAENAIHALRNRLALLRDPEGIERLLACALIEGGQEFDVTIHFSQGRIIVEAERATARTFGDVTGTLRGMFARLDEAPDLTAFLAAAARQMRALTGFDRVMILRFEEDGRGRIVAEYSRGGVPSLLGKHLPPDHLPLEERRCLQRSSLHLSAEIDAELTPLIIASGSEPPDLSRAALRPLAPAYCDELRRMDARAAMSIALNVGGSLWGVIACVHHTTRSPGFERRSIADLFAQLLALRIEIFELKARMVTSTQG